LFDIRSADLTRRLKWLILFAALAASAVVGIYMYSHWGQGMSRGSEIWGQFGDYIGGVLNPVLGFLTFTGLLFTIALQYRELEQARQANLRQAEELDAARETRDAALAAQRAQVQLMVRQNDQITQKQKLDDLDKSIRLQSVDLTEYLEDHAFDRPDMNPTTRREALLKTVGKQYQTSSDAYETGILIAESSIERLRLLGGVLATYDVIQTPESSPEGPHEWYFTNTWRRKHLELVNALNQMVDLGMIQLEDGQDLSMFSIIDDL